MTPAQTIMSCPRTKVHTGMRTVVSLTVRMRKTRMIDNKRKGSE